MRVRVAGARRLDSRVEADEEDQEVRRDGVGEVREVGVSGGRGVGGFLAGAFGFGFLRGGRGGGEGRGGGGGDVGVVRGGRFAFGWGAGS